MSDGRRTYWPRAIALAALVLSCLTGSPPARAGSGGPRPASGKSPARCRVALRTTRPAGCPAAALEIGPASPAVEEESRRGDDIETEIDLDTAPSAVVGAPASSASRADSAREARAVRRPYLLTAHLRF